MKLLKLIVAAFLLSIAASGAAVIAPPTMAQAVLNAGAAEKSFTIAPGHAVEWVFEPAALTDRSTVSVHITDVSGALFSGNNPASLAIFAPDGRQLEYTSGVVNLGTFAPGDKIQLRAVAELPLTAGNEYRGATGRVQWQFDALGQSTPASLAGTGGDELWLLGGAGFVLLVAGFAVRQVMHLKKRDAQ